MAANSNSDDLTDHHAGDSIPQDDAQRGDPYDKTPDALQNGNTSSKCFQNENTTLPGIRKGSTSNRNDNASNEKTAHSDSESSKANVDEASLHRQNVLRRELSRMQERDDNARLMRQETRLRLEKEAKKNLPGERLQRGYTILPGAAVTKKSVKTDIELEERISLKEKQDVLRAQSKKIKSDLDRKYGISDLPKGQSLVAMAAEFYSNDRVPNAHLPPHVTKELTTEEINDFRLVFDLFDAKNKGFITSHDLQQVAAMLGLNAKKRVFREMIESTPTTKKGRVNFVNFLELVIRLQGDGPDPVEDIKKGFSLLDAGSKGYLTFEDVRAASDELEVHLSNRAIRDMMMEADMTGDGTVSLEEFERILMQTTAFKGLTSY